MRWALAALVAAALLTGAPASAQTGDYRIEAGDQLAITVLEDPGLNTTALVRPDGKISLPLAGTITAAGRTPEAVRDAIRRALAESFVEPPTVNVALTGVGEEQTPPVVYVLGAVTRPGAIEIDRPIDILQALALAGGMSPFAASQRIQLRRVTSGGQSIELFDYEAVEDGAVPIGQMPLRDGDVIVVPERGLFE